MDLEAIRRITIQARTEGVDAAVASMKNLAAAQDGVASTATKSERATLNVERSYNSLKRQVDVTFRAQQDFEKGVTTLARAQAQGLVPHEEMNTQMALLTQRYNQTVAAAGNAGKATAGYTQSVGLARHELINLSRQAQDVAVSLGSGQGIGTVLLQQGSQIADVFASSRASVGSFFTQAVNWGARFVTSAAGVAIGAAAITAGLIYMRESATAADREIERSLAGIGRASGVTRDQIHAISRSAAAGTALTISEAREAATEFAATGKIYGENVAAATNLTKDFARAAGIDAADAAKALSSALVDPVSGAQKLNESLGFLDGKTLQLIRTLESQNRHQEAQKVLMDAAAPSIKQQAENVSDLAKAYDRVRSAASAASKFMSGAPNTDEQQLEVLRKQIESARNAPAALLPSWLGGNEAVVAELTKRFTELKAKIEGAAQATADARFRQFSVEADDAVRSIFSQIAGLEKLEAAYADIKRAREGVSGIAAGYGGEAAVDPKQISGRQGLSQYNDAAAQALELQTRLGRESLEQTIRHNAEVMKLGASYGGVSLQTAQILEQQRRQLSIATAVTEAERLAAQETATRNQLISDGVKYHEAVAIAAGQRAIAEAGEMPGIFGQIESLGK